VSFTEESLIEVAVGQVHQELGADRADEVIGMESYSVSDFRGEDAQLTHLNHLTAPGTLLQNKELDRRN